MSSVQHDHCNTPQSESATRVRSDGRNGGPCPRNGCSARSYRLSGRQDNYFDRLTGPKGKVVEGEAAVFEENGFDAMCGGHVRELQASYNFINTRFWQLSSLGFAADVAQITSLSDSFDRSEFLPAGLDVFPRHRFRLARIVFRRASGDFSSPSFAHDGRFTLRPSVGSSKP